MELRDRLKKIISRIQKPMFAIGGFFLLLLIFKLCSFYISDGDYQETFNSKYQIFALNLPKDLNFAGEKVPENDFTVRESVDKELMINTYWQSQTLLMHKRANRWFPIIEPILKSYGIPDDFKYLSLTESRLSNESSAAGAVGFWQLLPSTAKSYGLEVDENVDERYNVQKSTVVACKYFKDAYNALKNWTLVAASYNEGIAGVEKQLSKQQVCSYYDLLLNNETARYVFRVLAIKEIISHPKLYGFILRKSDLYPSIPTYSLQVDSSIGNLVLFAQQQNVNYKILKYFNPWLRQNSLDNPDKKTYTFEFPKKGIALNDLPDYDGSLPLTKEDSLLYVDKKNNSPVVCSPKGIIYSVKPNESLFSVSQKYSVTETLIKVWNNLDDTILKTGQELVLFPDKNVLKK
ncbi:MAG: transglycosylase SLT domain-containing protein [Bacteroidia bacterium]